MQSFIYDHAETVPAFALAVGDIVLKTPDRPLRVTRLQPLNVYGRVRIWAHGVYQPRYVTPGNFGSFNPTDTVQRAVL